MIFLIKILLFPISYSVYLMPRMLQVKLSNVIGSFIYRFTAIRKKVVLENLKIAFPEWTDEKRSEVAEKSYQNLVLNIFEYLILFHFKKKDYNKYFEIKSLKTIQEQLDNGSGALVLSLHQGAIHFGLVGFALGGYPGGATLKIRGMLMKDLVDTVCLKFGITPIADRNNPYDIFRLLKSNKPIVFVMDQYMGSPQGIEAKFFSKPAGTAAGLAAFSLKSKLKVVPAYNFRRESDGKIVIVSKEPITIEEKDTKQATIHYMTEKYNAKLEEIIRQYPEQWFWVHRRWKSFS